jgi:small subunit ribosomal protein S20
MPIKYAALKQLRKDRKRRARNQAARSGLRTLTKRLLGLLKDQNTVEASQLLAVVAKRYDQAAAKGTIHRNRAARVKSRLARRVTRRPAPATVKGGPGPAPSVPKPGA